MSETNELFASVNYIKNKVDTIEKIELLNLRANKDLKEEYISMLTKDKLLLKVYKATDGIRMQKEIADTIGTSEMNVSNKMKILYESGLVEVKSVSGKKITYTYTVVEKAFHLTRLKDE